MKNTSLFITLAVILIIASVAMYMIGSGSTHLDELVAYAWLPLPLAFILIAIGFKKK